MLSVVALRVWKTDVTLDRLTPDASVPRGRVHGPSSTHLRVE